MSKKGIEENFCYSKNYEEFLYNQAFSAPGADKGYWLWQISQYCDKQFQEYMEKWHGSGILKEYEDWFEKKNGRWVAREEVAADSHEPMHEHFRED